MTQSLFAKAASIKEFAAMSDYEQSKHLNYLMHEVAVSYRPSHAYSLMGDYIIDRLNVVLDVEYAEILINRCVAG